MKTVQAMTVAMVMMLGSGCASFIASNTSTAVGTDSGVRSLGQAIIDKSIARTAKINMYKLDPRFKQSRVNIESFHGNVLLTGQVPDANLKKLAEDNLKAMSEVKVIHNYITVGEQATYSTIMQDIAVTGNTKGLIMRAPVISDNKVLLHTENGVLYVMGRLNNAELADLNKVLQNVGNVTKIITLIDNVENLQQQSPIIATTPTAGQSGLQPSIAQPIGVGLNAIATPLATDGTIHTTPIAIDPNEEQPTEEQPTEAQPEDSPAQVQP